MHALKHSVSITRAGVRRLALFSCLFVLGAALLPGCGGGGSGSGGSSGGGGGSIAPPNPPTSLTVRRGAVQLSHFTLTWNPSSSADVVGYVIYRKLEAESSFRRVGGADQTTFTDTSVPASVAFDRIDYYVTAVNASAMESGPSNTATMAPGVPPPPF